MAPQNIAEFFCCLDEKTPKKSTPKKCRKNPRRKNAEKMPKKFWRVFPSTKLAVSTLFFMKVGGMTKKAEKILHSFCATFFLYFFFIRYWVLKKFLWTLLGLFRLFRRKNFKSRYDAIFFFGVTKSAEKIFGVFLDVTPLVPVYYLIYTINQKVNLYFFVIISDYFQEKKQTFLLYETYFFIINMSGQRGLSWLFHFFVMRVLCWEMKSQRLWRGIFQIRPIRKPLIVPLARSL